MIIADKLIEISDEIYEAEIHSDKSNLYVVIFPVDDIDNSFVSSYYPSTKSYVYCIRQAAREYIKHLENIKELEAWEGVI